MLKDREDAQGRGIYNYFTTGEGGFEVVERDDGYIDVSSGPVAYLAQFKNWRRYQKAAMRFVRGKTLDIGCGACRHALYLQGRGLEVVAIDISPLALKTCRKRGMKKTKLISIDDVSRKLGVFDTILMLGNNFGLFENFKKAKQLLKRLHKLTSVRGRIIAETLDPYQTEDPNHLQYHKRNKRAGRMAGQVRIRIRYKRYITPWFDYLFVSKKELSDILEGTGWKVMKFLDSKHNQYIAVIDKSKKVMSK